MPVPVDSGAAGGPAPPSVVPPPASVPPSVGPPPAGAHPPPGTFLEIGRDLDSVDWKFRSIVPSDLGSTVTSSYDTGHTKSRSA